MPTPKSSPHELPQKPLRDLFPSRTHPAVYGIDMYELFASSSVVIDRHTDRIHGEVGNMRMFEATGVGACLLVDRGSNLGDLFVDGEEVVSYESVDDCVEKIKFLTENSAFAAEIGRRGQARTLADHTYSNRARQILSMI
jgi:spore maturation protein CgeB